MGPSTDISRSAPCQITSAIPGHIALGVTPNTALSGPQTADRPQPRGWGLGAFGLSGVYQPSENQSTSRNMAVIRVASGCASMGSNR